MESSWRDQAVYERHSVWDKSVINLGLFKVSDKIMPTHKYGGANKSEAPDLGEETR
jgi:hypothetical protein